MPPKKTNEIHVEEETCPIQECKITLVNPLVECPFCNFKGCLKCYKYFTLNSNAVECMNCKNKYSQSMAGLI